MYVYMYACKYCVEKNFGKVKKIQFSYYIILTLFFVCFNNFILNYFIFMFVVVRLIEHLFFFYIK